MVETAPQQIVAGRLSEKGGPRIFIFERRESYLPFGNLYEVEEEEIVKFFRFGYHLTAARVK